MIGRERPGEQSEVAQLIQQTLEQERWQREMMEQRYAQYGEDDEEVGTPGLAASIIAPWWLDGALHQSTIRHFPRPCKEAQSTFPSPSGAPSLREVMQTPLSRNLESDGGVTLSVFREAS